ncbi:BMC domain-containing protein [Paenibacillus sp. IHBB 10380]|uniref:BMC domain-containing protein n=1 Tax=Paenibacillus sp. IHBB 10380 TaxID=1566358 RepID=UPI0009E5F674|nr:BMC domain-containing protein [Paenibacillus sp. IHBB 10380]
MAMKNIALGLVEVRGYLGAIAAADAALKAASVTCIGLEIINGGLVTVKITGDVGAVQAAVEAGADKATQLNVLLTRHVIARLHEETAAIVMMTDIEQAEEQSAVKDTYDENAAQDSTDTAELDTPSTDAEEADVVADAVEEKADAVSTEPDADKLDFGRISVTESAADKSELSVQAMNKRPSPIIVIDLPKEPAKEQAGSTGASPVMKSRKPVVKETSRTTKTTKSRL